MTGTPVRASARGRDRPLGVVIADDHAIFRDGLRRLLEDAGLQVLGEARDGMEAVTLARKLTPDVLLLDLSMPKHSGLEALHELGSSSQGNPVRVILLTAAAEKTEIVMALNLGARGVVMKASATEVLLTAIASVMAGDFWGRAEARSQSGSVFAGRAAGVQGRGTGKDLRAHPSGVANCIGRGCGTGEQGDCCSFSRSAKTL